MSDTTHHDGLPLGELQGTPPPVVHPPRTRCAAPNCTTILRRTNPDPTCSRPACHRWYIDTAHADSGDTEHADPAL